MQHTVYQWEQSKAGIASLETSKTSFGRKQATIRFTDEIDAAKLKELPELLNRAGIVAFPDVDEKTKKPTLTMYGHGNESRIINILQSHDMVAGTVQSKTFEVKTPDEIEAEKQRKEGGALAGAKEFLDKYTIQCSAALGMAGHAMTGAIGVILSDPARIANGIMYGLSTSLLMKYGSGQDEINFKPIMYKTSQYLQEEGIAFDHHVAGADRTQNAAQKLDHFVRDNAFAIANGFGGMGDAAQLISGLSDGNVGIGRQIQGATSLFGCAAQIFCDETPIDPEEMKYKNALEQGLAFVNAHPLAVAGNINLFQGAAGWLDAFKVKEKYEKVRETMPGKIAAAHAQLQDDLSGVSDERFGQLKNEYSEFTQKRKYLDASSEQQQTMNKEFFEKHLAGKENEAHRVAVMDLAGNSSGITSYLDSTAQARMGNFANVSSGVQSIRASEGYGDLSADKQIAQINSYLNALPKEQRKDYEDILHAEMGADKNRFGGDARFKGEKDQLDVTAKDMIDYKASQSKYMDAVPNMTVGVTMLYQLSAYLTSISKKSRRAEFSNEDAYREMYARTAQGILALPEEKREAAIERASVFLASQKEVKLTSDQIADKVRERVEVFEKAAWLDVDTSKERVYRMELRHEAELSEQRVASPAPTPANENATLDAQKPTQEAVAPQDKVSDISYGQRVLVPEQLAARMA